MSERNNDEAQAVGFVMALAGAAFAMMFFIIYAVVCFVAIALTVVMLVVLVREESVAFGQWIVTFEDARTFLRAGILGLVGLSLFMIFCAALLQAHIPDTWWPYILLGGYSFGAIAPEAIMAHIEQNKPSPFAALSPPAAPSRPNYVGAATPRQVNSPAAPAAPFRFASWDDEDAR